MKREKAKPLPEGYTWRSADLKTTAFIGADGRLVVIQDGVFRFLYHRAVKPSPPHK